MILITEKLLWAAKDEAWIQAASCQFLHFQFKSFGTVKPLMDSDRKPGIGKSTPGKAAPKHPDPQIRRAIKSMRADPCFRKLDKEWADLIPLERATLIEQILGAAPGKRNQRALTGLLSRHIKYESTIRYYRRMLKEERARHANEMPVPVGPVAQVDETESRIREYESTEKILSVPNPDAPTLATSPPSPTGPETTPPRADVSTMSEEGSRSERNAELSKIANDIVEKIKQLSQNSGAAQANLGLLRKRVQSRSDLMSKFSEIPIKAATRRSDSAIEGGESEDPILALDDSISRECEGVENELKVVMLAERFFIENPFWHRPRNLEEEKACVRQWKQDLTKMGTIDVENSAPKKHPTPNNS